LGAAAAWILGAQETGRPARDAAKGVAVNAGLFLLLQAFVCLIRWSGHLLSVDIFETPAGWFLSIFAALSLLAFVRRLERSLP
jgi:hypothetical protein